MDAYDYLLSGVMNGNPAGFDLPEDIESEMVIAMLDTCDDIIDSHRQKNRAFDVGCDERFSLWDWVSGFPFDRLREGMRVSVAPADRYGRYVMGEITKIREPFEQVVSKVNEPLERAMVTHVSVLTENKNSRYSENESLSFSNRDWDLGNGRVLAPVPVDGATLGKYPPKF